jgi:hypothetical protein
VVIRTEHVVAVLGMAALGAGWIISPGTTLLVIGGLIGGLGILAWVTGKLGI